MASKVEPAPNEPTDSPGQEAETKGQRMIHQGDIYWVQFAEPGGLEGEYAHPYVVLQDDLFNRSRIHSVVVCALTSNLKQASAPGNVLLEAGEANLPRPSVVVVSKISALDKTRLGEYIGSLTGERVQQILAGIQFLQLMSDHPEAGHEEDE